MGERVNGVAAAAYRVPTDVPEADGTLAWDTTTLVLARVDDAAGMTGLGWTYGPAAVAQVVHDQLAGVVTGRDVDDTAGTFAAMVAAIRNATRPGLAGYAVSAVDVALWDLKAKRLGLPLHRLLGGTADVPVYGSGGFTSYDDATLAAQLEGWRAEGIPRVKLKIGESWGSKVERDVARVAFARHVVGDACEVYVDANGGYGRKQAIRVGHALAEHGVSWYEEPVSSDDLAGLAQVRGAVTADVAAGEYGWDSYYFRRMCAADAIDCLQIDATRCGGVTEWMRAAAVAASFGLDVSAHCAPHVHTAMAAATPNFRHLEWFHDHVRVESAFFDGVLDPDGGRVRPREEPGLGLDFRDRDAERYRVG